ncbi:MAG TPA: SgcJ/EcaC family oxidoreductase [Edaphobacter sp.]|nr:SgcJ/EcaC family oxidoreductase [Edaphobacter sp.]
MSLTDEQQIRGVIDLWLEASSRGDLATIMSLMTDDVVFLTPGNPPMPRAEFEQRSRAATGKVSIDGNADVQEITVFGDTAICWNYLAITATPEGGEPIRRAGNVLSVFRRGEEGQWRIWRDANLLGLVQENK